MRKDLEANMRAAGFEPHDVDGYKRWKDRKRKKDKKNQLSVPHFSADRGIYNITSLQDKNLSVQEELFSVPRAREEFTLIPDDMELTQPRLEVALVVGMAGDEARFTFMGFKSHWQARDRTARNWDAMWVSWCLEWRRRNESRFEIGTIGHAVREKRRVEAALGAMANGGQSDRECMREAIERGLSSACGAQSGSMGEGNGNVLVGVFKRTSEGTGSSGNSEIKKISDGRRR